MIKLIKKIILLFKRKEKLKTIALKTPQEIERDRIINKYRLEFLETLNIYFIQYEFNDQWWYLRQWDDDYTFEKARGNGIRIRKPQDLEKVILEHQEWIKGGRYFLPFE